MAPPPARCFGRFDRAISAKSGVISAAVDAGASFWYERRMNRVVFALALLLGEIVSQAGVQFLQAKGTVLVSHDKGKKWNAIKLDKPLQPRVWLKTAADSFADVRFEDGSLMRVTENSVVGIDKSTMDHDGVEIQIDLREGRMCGIGKDFRTSSKYEVKTAVGVCGLRDLDTWFDVSSKGKFRCVRGKMVVVYVFNGVTVAPITLNPSDEIEGGDPFKLKIVRIQDDDLKALETELSDLKKAAGKRE